MVSSRIELVSNEIRTERTRITPELAKNWLGRNASNNRVVRNHRVELFARDMESGNWKLNAESIKFSKDGGLIDGQHRLLACVKANVPFESFVTVGLDTDAIMTIDSNMPRTNAQMLKMVNDTAYSSTVAGALRWIWAYRNKAIISRKAPTRHEVFELLEKEPAIEQSVKRVRCLNGIMTPSIAAATHYLFSKQDPTLAEMFFDALETGENMKHGDPVFMLRERLMQIRISRHKTRLEEIMALVLKAWNFTKIGRPIGQLKWVVTEEFPSIEDSLETGTMWRGRAREKAKARKVAAGAEEDPVQRLRVQ